MSTRPPGDLSHLELIADALGYFAGRTPGVGYHPETWDEYASAWLETPRGREALQRMAGPLRARWLTEPDADPFRWMPDGTPCWCISAEEPHVGWVHAPACEATLRERIALLLRQEEPT